MLEVEIHDIPSLTPREQSLLDMHSVVNVLNVLRNELCVLGLKVAEDENLFAVGLGQCDALLASLTDRQAALHAARSIDSSEAATIAEIESRLSSGGSTNHDHEIHETMVNIQSVFVILRVRAREFLAREKAPDAWQEFHCERLHKELQASLTAIEKNSKGRYRIQFNAALQEPTDYYVDLKIETDGTPLQMPPVLKDVIRDLIANARKYTAPGGRITAALFEDVHALHLMVEDNGRGIPEAEIHKVVEFGRRGGNVAEVRTMGGGFGLTKAFLVTQQFGGRMHIASEVGTGTRIRIWIPRDVAELAATAATTGIPVRRSYGR
jgi:signal transduction histidine kinase